VKGVRGADEVSSGANQNTKRVTSSASGAKHLEGEAAPPAFGTKAYWDREFGEGIYTEQFDWVCEWEDVAKEIATLVNQEDLVLVPGCGNAPFQLEMHDAGFKNLVCGDYSQVVIDQNKEANPEREIEWDLMDCTAMYYEDATFDVVLDKSLLDCLHCCDGANEITAAYLAEVHRVLKPGGKFLRLSFHEPKSMKAYMRGWDWTIETQMVPVKPPKEAVEAHEAKQEQGQEQAIAWKRIEPADGGEAYFVNGATGATSFEDPTKEKQASVLEEKKEHSLLQGLPDGVCCLCVCVKSEEQENAPSMSFGAKSKSDKKKAEKNKRRLMRMLEEEATQEGTL